jgi:multiple sugar transport system substrate-binding protein
VLLGACGSGDDGGGAAAPGSPAPGSGASPGATGAPSAGGGESLSFWQFHAPGGPSEARNQWFADLVEGWREETGGNIDLRYIPVQEYLSGATLQTAFTSGAGPDLFVISPGDFLRYYNGGALLDLRPFLSEEAFGDYAEGTLDTRMVDEGLYGLPLENDPLAMFYSVAAFEDAGLSEADIPETWDELLNVADMLRTGDQFGVMFETNPGYYQNFTWYPFMWQGGADAVQDGNVGFSDPGAVQALAFWQQAIEEDLCPREPLGTGANSAAANVGAGYTAIQQSGMWNVAALANEAPDFEYGVFTLPVPDGGEYVNVLGGWAFCANAGGANPEAAGEFCAWAVGSMSDESISRLVEWNTEIRTAVPPRISVQEQAQEAGAFDSEEAEFFLEEAFPGGRGEPRYPPEIYRSISDALQDVQLAGADPQSRADQASEEIDSFLQGYDGAPIL